LNDPSKFGIFTPTRRRLKKLNTIWELLWNGGGEGYQCHENPMGTPQGKGPIGKMGKKLIKRKERSNCLQKGEVNLSVFHFVKFELGMSNSPDRTLLLTCHGKKRIM